MTEGTRSYLIGCHQFLVHPIAVILAWRLEYRMWPRWWVVVCIFLHDIGICGRQYLSDDTAKSGHWHLGARWSAEIAWRFTRSEWLFKTCYDMCAGHSPRESGAFESLLFRADKRSWLLGSDSLWNPLVWWLWWNYWVEWSGKYKVIGPLLWREVVRKSLKDDGLASGHELYIKYREKQ